MRITKMEIESAVEGFVNCIYDCTDENGFDESGWSDATFDEWLKATYEELITWKTDNHGSYWHSNVNRFEGKENILKKIEPVLINRLKELKEEGYNVKALEEVK